jgi:carbon-monoxide dehydrogenase small subunit
MKKSLTMKLNGREVQVEVEPAAMLVDVLRDELGLTGTKVGCRAGDCGTCTVIIDGEAMTSCLVPALKVNGREVITIEGLAEGDRLHPLQQAFIDHGAVQCGFCTPGMLLSTKALLDSNPHPTREEIQVAIAGNLCRCTGYEQIIEAIQSVVATVGKEAADEGA